MLLTASKARRKEFRVKEVNRCSIFRVRKGKETLWGCSSVGRAPALQAGGQEFESLHLHAEIIQTCLISIRTLKTE